MKAKIAPALALANESGARHERMSLMQDAASQNPPSPDLRHALELLKALDGEMAPLQPYYVSLKVDRLVTSDELLTLSDEGFLSVWARWWKGQPPADQPAFSITDRGREAIARGTTDWSP